MIVVSNTSPLTSLATVGHFELLRSLYGEIHIAGGVWEELNKGAHLGLHPLGVLGILLQAKRLKPPSPLRSQESLRTAKPAESRIVYDWPEAFLAACQGVIEGVARRNPSGRLVPY